MSKLHVEASMVIDVEPAVIYAILSDYRQQHPSITPKKYFSNLIVEEGGQGAGTVYRVTVTVMGVKNDFHMVVSEPEPGRIIAERDLEKDLVTTFTIDPLENGKKSKVTIATDSAARKGLGGFMDKLFTPPVMRRIYQEELGLLANYVQNKKSLTGAL
ncbi:MAG TPA: SRPBCC family protein [Chloroflexia bacterium]|nr:SRPBCC family protein [Chloroflexia bacterium]